MPYHTVSQGDCLSSIADEHGFFWETLWNAPENAALKERCKDPNTLSVGDRVFVPEKRMKSFMRPTGARHTFKVKGVPVKFRVTLAWGDEPRANEPFRLVIDGETYEGVMTGEGGVEVNIRPGARSGSLIVGEGERETEYEVRLGALPSVEAVAGALERLQNLGYYDGAPTDTLDDDARAAVRAFQHTQGLDATGELDLATRSKLRELHDGA